MSSSILPPLLSSLSNPLHSSSLNLSFPSSTSFTKPLLEPSAEYFETELIRDAKGWERRLFNVHHKDSNGNGGDDASAEREKKEKEREREKEREKGRGKEKDSEQPLSTDQLEPSQTTDPAGRVWLTTRLRSPEKKRFKEVATPLKARAERTFGKGERNGRMAGGRYREEEEAMGEAERCLRAAERLLEIYPIPDYSSHVSSLSRQLSSLKSQSRSGRSEPTMSSIQPSQQSRKISSKGDRKHKTKTKLTELKEELRREELEVVALMGMVEEKDRQREREEKAKEKKEKEKGIGARGRFGARVRGRGATRVKSLTSQPRSHSRPHLEADEEARVAFAKSDKLAQNQAMVQTVSPVRDDNEEILSEGGDNAKQLGGGIGQQDVSKPGSSLFSFGGEAVGVSSSPSLSYEDEDTTIRLGPNTHGPKGQAVKEWKLVGGMKILDLLVALDRVWFCLGSLLCPYLTEPPSTLNEPLPPLASPESVPTFSPQDYYHKTLETLEDFICKPSSMPSLSSDADSDSATTTDGSSILSTPTLAARIEARVVLTILKSCSLGFDSKFGDQTKPLPITLRPAVSSSLLAAAPEGKEKEVMEILVPMEGLKKSATGIGLSLVKGESNGGDEGRSVDGGGVTKAIYSLVGKRVLRIDRRGREVLVGFA